MEPSRPNEMLPRSGYRALLVMLVVLAVAASVAVLVVQPSPDPVFEGSPITPYGYTISLVLFGLPVAGFLIWFARHRRAHPPWRAFWLTFAVVVGVWSMLDVLLARTFFTFPNPVATVGIYAPGFDPVSGWGLNVPVEEFLFYIGGCAFIVLAYIWSAEVWYPAATRDPAEYRSEVSAGLVLRQMAHPKSLALGLIVIAAAIAYKKLGPHGYQEGFPGYMVFIVLLVTIPAATTFRLVLRFVNLRAFLFALQALLLVALLWEVTLALPYGWWNYRSSQMVGIFIEPWSALPIEAVIVWGAAAWMNVSLYELFRLWGHAKEVTTEKPRSPAPRST
jgi:hypothetical protein